MQPTKTNLQNKSTNEQQGSVGANATRSMPSVPVLQKVAPEEELLQKKPNNTGLPDNLKSGVENLSGISMDDVKVHYNSSKPSQLQALAYAQGTDIHVAPGHRITSYNVCYTKLLRFTFPHYIPRNFIIGIH